MKHWALEQWIKKTLESGQWLVDIGHWTVVSGVAEQWTLYSDSGDSGQSVV
jgi:hypothetical protein